MSVTSELDVDIKCALLATWDVIGGDCLDAKVSVHGGDRYSTTMDREEVIDVVIDQVRNQGFLKGKALEYWEALSFVQMQEFARTCFVHQTYGW